MGTTRKCNMQFWRNPVTNKTAIVSHLLPISQTIQIRWTKHGEHYWWSKDKLISDVLLWTPTPECTRVGRSPRTYIRSVWTLDAVLEDLLRVTDKNGERDAGNIGLSARLNDISQRGFSRSVGHLKYFFPNLSNISKNSLI